MGSAPAAASHCSVVHSTGSLHTASRLCSRLCHHRPSEPPVGVRALSVPTAARHSHPGGVLAPRRLLLRASTPGPAGGPHCSSSPASSPPAGPHHRPALQEVKVPPGAPPYLYCLLAPFSAPSPSSERGRGPPPPPSTSAGRGDTARTGQQANSGRQSAAPST
ncbi:hypothetical protein NDU88_001976 [Pleurodeles waltl]|uniref:Uncharacterized protein n=1 Tax=Pleurodeles waltl TaxID=8319 RepID=A0AAV7P5H8_PLEWA|nr:hypothetical protein NDU88_001976 [Pleurodeles waltl]